VRRSLRSGRSVGSSTPLATASRGAATSSPHPCRRKRPATSSPRKRKVHSDDDANDRLMNSMLNAHRSESWDESDGGSFSGGSGGSGGSSGSSGGSGGSGSSSSGSSSSGSGSDSDSGCRWPSGRRSNGAPEGGPEPMHSPKATAAPAGPGRGGPSCAVFASPPTKRRQLGPRTPFRVGVSDGGGGSGGATEDFGGTSGGGSGAGAPVPCAGSAAGGSPGTAAAGDAAALPPRPEVPRTHTITGGYDPSKKSGTAWVQLDADVFSEADAVPKQEWDCQLSGDAARVRHKFRSWWCCGSCARWGCGYWQ
jgi:hypothetical protein